jgi:SAM-dependent methyltransferase
MTSERIPCVDGPGIRGEVRSWSEDPLTARAGRSGPLSPDRAQLRARGRGAIARLALRSGERVLDVACGNGNAALAAARRFAQVTGVDIAPNLIAQARRKARTAALPIARHRRRRGSRTATGIDTTVTMFGAMFAPRPPRAADNAPGDPAGRPDRDGQLTPSG